MIASAKTVPGTADHDSCMIAPTVPRCKGIVKAEIRYGPAHTQQWNSVAANRHGIVSRNHSIAAFPPSDCRPALRQDSGALTRSFRFRIPQPPAPRGREDRVCSRNKEGQRKLVLFCLCRDVSGSTVCLPLPARSLSPPPEEPHLRRREGSARSCMVLAAMRSIVRHARKGALLTMRIESEDDASSQNRISAATCTPRRASGRACRGCRPGYRPPRRQRRRA